MVSIKPAALTFPGHSFLVFNLAGFIWESKPNLFISKPSYCSSLIAIRIIQAVDRFTSFLRRYTCIAYSSCSQLLCTFWVWLRIIPMCRGWYPLKSHTGNLHSHTRYYQHKIFFIHLPGNTTSSSSDHWDQAITDRARKHISEILLPARQDTACSPCLRFSSAASGKFLGSKVLIVGLLGDFLQVLHVGAETEQHTLTSIHDRYVCIDEYCNHRSHN